jgi:hypothetical protein
MGMLIAPVEVRNLKVDYIYKLWRSLAPGPAGDLALQEQVQESIRTPGWEEGGLTG